MGVGEGQDWLDPPCRGPRGMLPCPSEPWFPVCALGTRAPLCSRETRGSPKGRRKEGRQTEPFQCGGAFVNPPALSIPRPPGAGHRFGKFQRPGVLFARRSPGVQRSAPSAPPSLSTRAAPRGPCRLGSLQTTETHFSQSQELGGPQRLRCLMKAPPGRQVAAPSLRPHVAGGRGPA